MLIAEHPEIRLAQKYFQELSSFRLIPTRRSQVGLDLRDWMLKFRSGQGGALDAAAEPSSTIPQTIPLEQVL